MDHHVALRAFNDHFDEFVQDILRVFPNDRECKTASVALRALRKANPRLILTVFGESVCVPYKNEIIAGDISFFVNKDYRDDMKFKGDVNTAVLDKIDKIRRPISQMSEEDKQSVIKYLQNLQQLVFLYQGIKTG